MMQIPSDIAPTTIASAKLCSSTISFHNLYGVSLSIIRNEIQKMITPRKANTIAFTTKPILTIRCSSFVRVPCIDATVDARIIPDRFRHVFDFVVAGKDRTPVCRVRRQRKQERSKYQDKQDRESAPLPSSTRGLPVAL